MYEKSIKHALNKLYHIIINKWPFFIPLPHESQLPVEFFIIKSLKLNILWIWPKVLAHIIQGNFQMNVSWPLTFLGNVWELIHINCFILNSFRFSFHPS